MHVVTTKIKKPVICYTECFFTATMFTRERLGVTLQVYCLSSSLDHPDIARLRLQIVKLLTLKFQTASCYFASLRSKHLPQHLFLEHDEGSVIVTYQYFGGPQWICSPYLFPLKTEAAYPIAWRTETSLVAPQIRTHCGDVLTFKQN